MIRNLLLPLMASIALPAMALPKLNEPGLHGVVNLGLMGGGMESNFIASIENFGLDLSDNRIETLDSPDAEDFVSSMFSFDIGWTFSNNKTRVSMGNDFTDILEFDRSLRLSLRHDFDQLGQMRVDALRPVGFETQVYRDPYLTGEKREDTNQDVSGVRVVWDGIANSPFGVHATLKERKISDEQSGESIDSLTPQERRLLEREGGLTILELNYRYALNEQNGLRPSISYVDKNSDGGAMAQEGYALALDHIYSSKSLEWGTKVVYTRLSGDERNPIFDETHNSDGWALSSLLIFRGDFLGKWSPNLRLSYAELDSDINFNDSAIWMFSAGVARRF
ncbi:MAG: DUF2860 family protein [Halioglobus sp.]